MQRWFGRGRNLTLFLKRKENREDESLHSSESTKARIRLVRKERHYVYLGLAFASPWIIGFLAFTVYPFFGSLYLSLTEYDLFSPPSGWGFRITS